MTFEKYTRMHSPTKKRMQYSGFADWAPEGREQLANVLRKAKANAFRARRSVDLPEIEFRVGQSRTVRLHGFGVSRMRSRVSRRVQP